MYLDYTKPWAVYILATKHTPTAVLWQDGPLLWIHLPCSPSKVLTHYYEAVANLIQAGRKESVKYFGQEPKVIGIPFTRQQEQWLWLNSDAWVIACAGFTGTIDNHYPSHKLLQFAQRHEFIFPKIVVSKPISNATLVFTDGSANGTAAFSVNRVVTKFQAPAASAQIVELRAVAAVFQQVSATPFNLYTDSAYIAQALRVLETVPVIGHSTQEIQLLFAQIQQQIHLR